MHRKQAERDHDRQQQALPGRRAASAERRDAGVRSSSVMRTSARRSASTSRSASASQPCSRSRAPHRKKIDGDEAPQDQPAEDLHDQTGDQLIGHRRDPEQPRERLVHLVERLVPERQERRRDRRDERLRRTGRASAPGGEIGGISGSGENTGHHMITRRQHDEAVQRQVQRLGAAPTPSTTAGQWVNSSTPLKIDDRHDRARHAAPDTREEPAPGTPHATSTRGCPPRAAAPRPACRPCAAPCAPCTSVRSARSCSGHSDATNSTAMPDRNSRRSCADVACPVSRSWRALQIR